MELECGYSPQDKTIAILSLFGSPYQHRPRLLLENNPGKSTAVRRSCFFPHSTDIDYKLLHTYTYLPSPDPSPPSLWTASLTGGSVTSAGNGCRTGRLLAGAGFLPLWHSLVSMVYVLLLLRCFFCSHTVLPKEHSLGVIFFLLTFLVLCCIFLQLPVFLFCLPPCHICMLCMYGQVDGLFHWYLWLVTIKGYYYYNIKRYVQQLKSSMKLNKLKMYSYLSPLCSEHRRRTSAVCQESSR